VPGAQQGGDEPLADAGHADARCGEHQHEQQVRVALVMTPAVVYCRSTGNKAHPATSTILQDSYK
jgi:hypothetical protein